MNPGGEPERDDTGLPPVDIEIPDDARDLDRDVQAYYRELRALRRSTRRTGWHRALGRDGIVLPLLACCLILALITGTLLTVFTATSDQNLTGLPGSRSQSKASSPAVPDTVVAGRLPNALIAVPGQAPVQVQTLSKTMLVLVPKGCACTGTLGWLAGVASNARLPAYVIYTPATKAEVERLYGQLPSHLRPRLLLAEETDGALTSATSPPAGIPHGELTAILLAPNRTATWVSHLSTRDSQAPLLRALTSSAA